MNNYSDYSGGWQNVDYLNLGFSMKYLVDFHEGERGFSFGIKDLKKLVLLNEIVKSFKAIFFENQSNEYSGTTCKLDKGIY